MKRRTASERRAAKQGAVRHLRTIARDQGRPFRTWDGGHGVTVTRTGDGRVVLVGASR